MEHYHKLRTLRTHHEMTIDRHKSQNLILLDPENKDKHKPKSPYHHDQLNNQSKTLKFEETKKILSQQSNSQANQPPETSFSYQKNTPEDQNRRNYIYDTESCKQLEEEQAQSTVQSNNEIFQMVFLNKPKFNESLSTAASFTKIKTSETQISGVNIHDFSVGRRMGSGKFGEVFIAKHRKTGLLFALKRIDKFKIDRKLVIQLIREIKIQSYLNHPNIVKLYTFFSDERYIYLVMELCYSGELYTFLKKKKRLPEDLTKIILKDTLKALDYMHEREIIHRDLKPQNIIFHNVLLKIMQGMIKLCDFGWSISSKTMRQTFCGTPLYVSPELLRRKNYNNKIDVWSVGILTYELLFGRVPFDINTERDFIKIVEDEIKFSKAIKISNQAKDFILICLKKDPRDRHTVAQLLEHSFIANIQPVQTSEMF